MFLGLKIGMFCHCPTRSRRNPQSNSLLENLCGRDGSRRGSLRPPALALALGVLTGCAAAPRPLLAPVSPAALGQSVEVRQRVTATFDGQTRVMQVALKVMPDDLTLIGLSAIGQRLFTLSWNGRDADLVSRVDDLGHLDPDRILADVELAYWPLSALHAALDSSLRLEQQGTARTLWQDGKLLWFASSATRNRWAGATTIYNAAVGYRLDIRPLSAEATTP